MFATRQFIGRIAKLLTSANRASEREDYVAEVVEEIRTKLPIWCCKTKLNMPTGQAGRHYVTEAVDDGVYATSGETPVPDP